DRHEGNRALEHDRALQHRLRRDAVRDVDDGRLGRDVPHDATADADEVVLDSEVGQKGDVAVAQRDNSCARANLSTAPTSRASSGAAAPTATPRPTDSATRDVSGPIDTAGALPPVQA